MNVWEGKRDFVGLGLGIKRRSIWGEGGLDWGNGEGRPESGDRGEERGSKRG